MQTSAGRDPTYAGRRTLRSTNIAKQGCLKKSPLSFAEDDSGSSRLSYKLEDIQQHTKYRDTAHFEEQSHCNVAFGHRRNVSWGPKVAARGAITRPRSSILVLVRGDLPS